MGTDLHHRFFYNQAQWLARRWPAYLEVDWEQFENEDDLLEMLPLLMPDAESLALDSQDRTARQWLEVFVILSGGMLDSRSESIPVTGRWSMLKRFIRRFVPGSEHRKLIEELYERKDYLSAYSEHTDLRVEQDPHAAIGGMWERMGTLQFNFLVGNGLQPHHKLLDIGCGVLRGGRHFIRYLNAGNYAGIDISPKAIDSAEELVRREGLVDKRPTLLVNRAKDLKLKEFSGRVFDYLLAQSVFTHLKPEHIEECFQNIGKVMSKDSVFFFTFNVAEEFEQTGLKSFSYPFSFFDSMAVRHGFKLEDRTDEYKHPKSQNMGMLSKRTG